MRTSLLPEGLIEVPSGQRGERDWCALSAKERRPVWLEHGGQRRREWLRWGSVGRGAARPCADLARVLGLFSMQWEAAEGFEGYLSGEVKQFLIHFSLFIF